MQSCRHGPCFPGNFSKFLMILDFKMFKSLVQNCSIPIQLLLLLFSLQVEGFNQKLHLVVDVFSKCLKSLADDITESQFNVFVQQLFKSHENIFLQPKLLSAHLCLNIIQSLHQPLFEKNKHLRSIKFGEFREFCRNFCTEMHIKALTQGNITEDHALNIMHNILNDLNIRKIENVSDSN